MANLEEKVEWTAGIYQFETTDPVMGGPNGVDNVQAKQLANRTQYLKQQSEINASTKNAGRVKLNSAIDSVLESEAATPLAVKKVNENAVSAHNRISQVHDYSKEVDGRVTVANNRITDVHEYAKSINNEVVSAHNRISQVHDFSKAVNGRVDDLVDKFQPSGVESRVYSADKRVYMLIRNDGEIGRAHV